MTPGELRHGAALAGLVRQQMRAALLRGGLASGWLAALREPRDAEGFASALGLDPDLAAAWLRAAEAHGLLTLRGGRYGLGAFARWCVEAPESDAALAILEQAAESYVPVITRVPALAAGAPRPSFGAGEEAVRTARASRITERATLRALQRVPGARDARRILDVGCGEGTLLVRILEHYRDAVGDGVELDPEVAERARRHLREAGIHRRCEIHTGDVLELELPVRTFDLVVMSNDLYYFDDEQQLGLFSRLRERLAEGGVLAILTPVAGQGRLARLLGTSAMLAGFDLFLRAHTNLQGLPEPAGLNQRLRTAGFETVGAVGMLPARVVWARRGRRRGRR